MSEAKVMKLEDVPKEIPNPFARASSQSDVILKVEKKMLHVSKLVLSLASPVFKAMFTGDYKEKTSDIIPLPKKKYEDVLEFLLCIYPSTCKRVTRENLDVVLPLAHEYQVQHLIDRCEEFVLTTFENKDTKISVPETKELAHYLFLADRYGLNTLLTTCVDMMKDRTMSVGENQLKKMRDFTMTSIDTRLKVFEARMHYVETDLSRTHSTSNNSWNLSPYSRSTISYK